MLKCSAIAAMPFLVVIAYMVMTRVAINFFDHNLQILDGFTLIACSFSSVALPLWGFAKRVSLAMKAISCLILPPVYFFLLLYMALILHMALTGDGV
jgi:hypothetical protein